MHASTYPMVVTTPALSYRCLCPASPRLRLVTKRPIGEGTEIEIPTPQSPLAKR